MDYEGRWYTSVGCIISTSCRRYFRMMETMTHKITLLPGDCIGPEVANAATQIVEASGVSGEWEFFAAPLKGGKRGGEFPREQAVESVRRTRVAPKAPAATGLPEGPPSINV